MNITRENLSELDLLIKVEIVEEDYAERVKKQLKKYQKQATIPGFRKGMAPMAMIEKLYKNAILSEEVENLLSESLFNYIDSEKLEIIGSPLSNQEKTGEIDFAAAKDYTFYFDAAVSPKVEIDWSKIDAKMTSIKVAPKDVENQIEMIAMQNGKFETPETVGEKDHVYGKAVELDKEGKEVEGGMNTFTSFDLGAMKDDEQRNLFVGKKNNDEVVFNAGKAFKAEEIEKNFHLEAAAAKKFKADVKFTISGCSRITPAEMNEELWNKVFPGQEIKSEKAFKENVKAQIEKANDEQSQILFTNQVHKALIENFSATMPEAFLKRWILSRSKDLTAEQLDEQWAENYVPGLKWELIEVALEKFGKLRPTMQDIEAKVVEILDTNEPKNDEESDEDRTKRLAQAAKTIAQDRKNVQQLEDRLFSENMFKIFFDQLKPETEKVTVKEFQERCK